MTIGYRKLECPFCGMFLVIKEWENTKCLKCAFPFYWEGGTNGKNSWPCLIIDWGKADAEIEKENKNEVVD